MKLHCLIISQGDNFGMKSVSQELKQNWDDPNPKSSEAISRWYLQTSMRKPKLELLEKQAEQAL